jgi:chorismate dehydratase
VKTALEGNDAVLLIGDEGLEAMHFPRPEAFRYDLGDLWYEWVGLPMVYAVWATRIDVKEDMQILLSGKGVNEDVALALTDRLRANPKLANVWQLPISQVGGSSQDISFAISLTIKEAK